MDHRERMVIYGALLTLTALHVATWSSAGSYAVADDAAAQTTLGPVETLTLSGPDSAEDLVLRNAEGRLAWADDPHARAFSFGLVHVGRAVGPLLEGEQYREEYARVETELRESAEEMDARIAAFLEEHQEVSPDDPEAPEIRQAYQLLLQERERLRADASRQLGELAAGQIERAYREFVAAVEVVAERRGIDVVLRFIPTELEFQASNPPQAYTGIRGRVALKYPESIDITDDVLEELALELE